MVQALAPKHVRKPIDTRWAFGFAGNRLLLRELISSGMRNPLLVTQLLVLRFAVATNLKDLHLKVRHSEQAVPAPLSGASQSYFTPEASRQLQAWLGDLDGAIASRHAAVRESYEKQGTTISRTCGRKGKKPTGYWTSVQSKRHWVNVNQRIWGVSGKVFLGVKLAVPSYSQPGSNYRCWTF